MVAFGSSRLSEEVGGVSRHSDTVLMAMADKNMDAEQPVIRLTVCVKFVYEQSAGLGIVYYGETYDSAGIVLHSKAMVIILGILGRG